MDVIYGQKNYITDRPSGIGLGAFDGLHKGHMELVDTLVRESSASGLKSVVYTFSQHPENILNKKIVTFTLTPNLKKEQLLAKKGIDCLFFDTFDETYAKMEPEDFVRRILLERFNMKLAVAGFNYTFGHRGAGDVRLLKKLGRQYGFRVIEIPPVMVGDEVVSSTLIRNFIIDGKLEKAAQMLGRHYSISGRVVEGKKLGSRLGFPTANIIPEEYLVLPPKGVYLTYTKTVSGFYKSITNLGTNPTVEDEDKVRMETHIIQCNDNLYGQDIEVYFIHKIRDEIKFENDEQLARQVKKDISKAARMHRFTSEHIFKYG